MRDLSALFNPKSVAIIGASSDPKKVGAIILKNIIDSKFSGSIYPVNPNFANIQNLQCFKSVTDIPDVPDLAIIVVPALKNLEVLSQIGEKGIENVVCIAAGFKESGEEGKKLEEKLLEIAQKYEINLLGPNCLGFVNNLSPINATFGEPVNHMGNLRFVTQSGAIAASIFDWCNFVDLGFSEFVTLGNKTIINENDVLNYFKNLPSNKQENIEGLSKLEPIGLYLESISDGENFLKITKEISLKNPIFILKPGKTKAAKIAMQSHTGAMAGEDLVLEEALKEGGVIRCETLEDFFDLSKAFSLENIPDGNSVAIISNAGGPAVISADAIFTSGLKLAEFDEKTAKNLLEILPRSASILNPVDVLGDALAERFTKAAEIILQGKNINALIVILTPQMMTQIEITAHNLGDLSKKYQKPIFCSFLGGKKIAEGERILDDLKIPVFRFPERAIYVLGKMWQWKNNQINLEKKSIESEINLDFSKAKEILENAKKLQQKTLDNFASNEIISSIGINTPPTLWVGSFGDAKNFADQNRYPVVLKLSSPGLLHKKDIGGVITGINNNNDLESAWDKMERNISHLDLDLQKNIHIQIQKQIVNGVEVILGVKKDPNFGPVLLFGAGGTLAELLGDRNLHLLPMDLEQAKNLVEKSKIFPLLSGFRGESPLALDKLYDVILRLGKLADPSAGGLEISEIEINPLILTLNNAWAVDCKVVLTSGESKSAILQQFKIAQVLGHQILASTYHLLEFAPDEPLKFLPGQYITIKVANNKINAYSIATYKGEKNFSLLVDIKPGGLGSHFFASLKVGDKISFLGPFGKFTLNLEDGSKQLLFLGTGSGVAPLRCQIESALKEKNCKLPITLYLGLETNKDLFWQDVFQKLKDEYPNFNFKVAIHEPLWGYQGYKGYITELLKNDLSACPAPNGIGAYLCGNKNMIADATAILLEKNCLKERIYIEKY
ncbi:MAG: acetate--CoA ligase family protein [Candidatus Daviesbacteria bacterium]|nr:acetate--CoA ligase family protein [Candidatus Daviesbacteria bacterium]